MISKFTIIIIILLFIIILLYIISLKKNRYNEDFKGQREIERAMKILKGVNYALIESEEKIQSEHRKRDQIYPLSEKLKSIMITLNGSSEDESIYIRNKIDAEYSPGFSFTTSKNISDNIEKFFNTYLLLIDTNYINQKVAQYIDASGTMQSIFTQNNASILDFTTNTFDMLNKIYFSHNSIIDESNFTLYGIFSLIKFRIKNELNSKENYIYKYDGNKFVYMIPKKISLIDLANTNIIFNTDDCSGNNICKINIKTIAGQDIWKKLKKNKSQDIDIIRYKISDNINNAIILCELYIVQDLFAIAYGALKSNQNYQANMNILQTNPDYISLQNEINYIKGNSTILSEVLSEVLSENLYLYK